jgi:hypothetical protein
MKKRSEVNSTDTLLKLYQIYDDHRNARLWFLDGLDATNYNEYNEKYSGASMERCHFVAVCGFFFNPTPFWNKARPIIEGMRIDRPYIYENFESLNSKRLTWKKERRIKRKAMTTRRM